ncbi:hypothetical protein MMC28_010058 [Mycoblastus sanguinarius]|nr:hypothetical protein [Mycoblastus sanguinarius]
MDQLAQFLQSVGYHFAQTQPLVPSYLHLIVSALFPIYTGAHASLSRPSSAAKPPKRKKVTEDDNDDDDDDDDDEHEQKMEGMSPSDAIMLPLLAGMTLGGLYYLIKWLEDPAILNKVLNWYFSIFGVVALARLLTDAMGVISSFCFPSMYVSDGKLRKAYYGAVGGFLSRKMRVRLDVHKVMKAHFKIGPQGISSIFLAVAAQLYFNLVDKPWWLTNLLGFSFAYTTLQILSPTTSWTGTLILGALFFYDIYFVFYTPLMVTVATQLDIPAKLLFPRPARADEDPTKQWLSMLGLGDVVLPGMMIGFALRFDLYLFYLRKASQKVRASTDSQNADKQKPSEKKVKDNETIKAKWYPATGGWGERFWTTRADKANELAKQAQGYRFPKTYFHASLIGYVLGMLFTLAVMQIYGHAQPALLYLVPGTLGAFWGTSLAKGDIKTLWAYTEAEEEEEPDGGEKGKKENRKADDWMSKFWVGRASKRLEESAKKSVNVEDSSGETKEPKKSGSNEEDGKARKEKGGFYRDRKRELVFFSIDLPSKAPSRAQNELPKVKAEEKSNGEVGETY